MLQSYNNTQQTIQFFDTKAGAYLAGNGVAASLLVNNIIPYLSELIKVDRSLLTANLSIFRNISLFLLTLLALLFLYETGLVFLQSFFVLSPKSGLKLVKKGSAKGLFWIEDIRNFVEKTSVHKYATTMSALSTTEIVEELAYETAKISFIATAKLSHLGSATKHFKRTIILWALALLFIGLSRALFQFFNIL
ncbi:MAG: hypothetical protein PHQ36_10835 [Anaerolineales bacterium]|nr:hypothetical protein [Anaerolineales bacterium]